MMNRMVQTARGTVDVCAQNENTSEATIAAAFLPLARLLAPLIREELSRCGDEWIDQHSSPLGKRKHCELARIGAFPARYVRRRWLARRADVDTYIEAQHGAGRIGARPANDAAPVEDDPGVSAVLAEHGFELAPKAARGARAERR